MAMRQRGNPPAFAKGADQGMQKPENQEKPVQSCNRRAWQDAVQTKCFSRRVPAALPSLQARLRVTEMNREIRGWGEESAAGRLPAPLASAACESFPQMRSVFAFEEGSACRSISGRGRLCRCDGGAGREPRGGRGRWHRFSVMPTPYLSQGQFLTSSAAVPKTLSMFQNFPENMALSFPCRG